MKEINIDWINIKYETYWNNKNKTILILHWRNGSSKSWTKIGNILSNNFYIIIPNIPCASSIIENCNRNYTLDDYASLINKLINKLKLKDIILLWHSNWWAIATKLITSYNNNIKTLILNNSAGIRNTTKKQLKKKLLYILSKIFKIFFLLPWTKKIKKLFYKIIWAHDYLNAQENMYKKQTFLNMIKEDLKNIFPKIKIKTFLIRWEKDTYTPLSDWILINKLIKNSKLIVINDAKHWIHLQNPEKLAKVIFSITKNTNKCLIK